MAVRKWVQIGAFAASALTGFAAAAFFLFQPLRISDMLSRLSPEVLFRVRTDQPLVALTIDDGPHPTSTPQILDVLAEHDAQATFFLISDHVPGNETLVERMLDEGHEIGNHSVADEPSIRQTPEEFAAGLARAGAILDNFNPVRYFRPGSGLYDQVMLDEIAAQGYRNILGSVYPFDPHIPHTGFATWYVLQNAAPGAIVILHDGGERGARTAAVLEKVLPALRERGYRVVTVSELLAHGEPQE